MCAVTAPNIVTTCHRARIPAESRKFTHNSDYSSVNFVLIKSSHPGNWKIFLLSLNLRSHTFNLLFISHPWTQRGVLRSAEGVKKEAKSFFGGFWIPWGSCFSCTAANRYKFQFPSHIYLSTHQQQPEQSRAIDFEVDVVLCVPLSPLRTRGLFCFATRRRCCVFFPPSLLQ